MTFSQKVRLMPALAALCFGVVLVINEVAGARNSRLMSAIETGQVPAQESSREVEALLVDAQQTLHYAAAAADPHALTEADAISRRITSALSEARSNPAFPPGEVDAMEQQFARYYTLARRVGTLMLSQQIGEELQPEIVKMTTDYTSLRQRLQASTAHQRRQMDSALGEARGNGRRSIRLVTLVLSLALVALVVVSSRVVHSTLASLRAAVDASAALRRRQPSSGAPERVQSADELTRLVESLSEVLAALANSEQRLNEAQRLAHVGSWEWNARESRATWSDELCRVFGLTDRLPVSLADHLQLVHEDDRNAVEVSIRKAYAQRQSLRATFRIVRPGGEVRIVLAHNETMVDPSGKVMAFHAAVQDVTESEEAATALREGEKRYRTLFEDNPQPMWVHDADSLRFLAVNDAALAHYGYSREEFLAMDILDIRPIEDVEAARASARVAPEGLQLSGVWRHKRKDGSLLEAEISSHGTRFGARRARLVLANDVTERKRLEEHLRQSQKMDAIGRLAGGVAHDFNNILSVILGYSEIVRRRLAPEDPLQSKVAEIVKAGDRAAGLTRQLLTFSRKQVVQPRVLDLNTVVSDMHNMLRRLIGEDVTLKTLPAEGLGSVEADPGQLEQVIMNLAVNARDAMPDGGTLTIETRDVDLDQGYARAHPGTTAGPHVMLAVSDTGLGMSAETVERIYEPFFTTKALGKGTGLGLSTVYGIVKEVGGCIDVDTELGHGTTFKVYLPRVQRLPETPQSPPEPRAALTSSATVLLVEDEPALRELVSEVLGQAGYQVIASSQASEAIACAKGHKGTIDVVLTDVVMPGMNGKDLVQTLKPLLPGARAVFMSGYTDDAIGHHGLLDPDVRFLQKPFTSDQLLKKIREALAAGPATD